MKFIHLSDLHLGKRVNEFSMIEDQEYILKEILEIIDDNSPCGVIIAGDIYDKPVPPAEAVKLFDEFVTALASRKLDVFIISGNHDSAERLSFGSSIMDVSGIHISPVYDGTIEPAILNDEYGEICIYMLPFIKPAHVRRYFGDDIVTYNDALSTVISSLRADFSKRNILVTHQFVTGSRKCESEEISVGGTDNIDVAVFDGFDYVALGHIHSPQKCTSEFIRYCGTPLKYSFSEAGDNKSVTVIDFGPKGNISLSTVPLVPMRDMHEIKGSYNELMQKSYYEGTTYTNDYMHITLTDEEEIPDAMARLRTVYHNLMKLNYDNARTRKNSVINAVEEAEKRNPLDLFSDFYELQNNSPMSDEQKELVAGLISEIWEDEI